VAAPEGRACAPRQLFRKVEGLRLRAAAAAQVARGLISRGHQSAHSSSRVPMRPRFLGAGLRRPPDFLLGRSLLTAGWEAAEACRVRRSMCAARCYIVPRLWGSMHWAGRRAGWSQVERNNNQPTRQKSSSKSRARAGRRAPAPAAARRLGPGRPSPGGVCILAGAPAR
jgi:hypothetical protein